MHEERQIFCDGLCEPHNPGGYACYGWLAQDSDGQQIAQGYGCVAQGAGATNNLAEYAAVIAALRHSIEKGWHDIDLLTDSQLVVNQVTGRWQCRAENLQPLWAEARRLLKVARARISWIPRTQNERADALSRRAYREAQAGLLPMMTLNIETEVV
jgi:ribonuclease HI